MISTCVLARKSAEVFGVLRQRLWMSIRTSGSRATARIKVGCVCVCVYVCVLLQNNPTLHSYVAPKPRLACVLVLQAKFGAALAVLGTVCASWVLTSRGSTQRDPLVTPGNTEHPSVRAGNLMVSRTHCTFLFYRGNDYEVMIKVQGFFVISWVPD